MAQAGHTVLLTGLVNVTDSIATTQAWTAPPGLSRSTRRCGADGDGREVLRRLPDPAALPGMFRSRGRPHRCNGGPSSPKCSAEATARASPGVHVSGVGHSGVLSTVRMFWFGA